MDKTTADRIDELLRERGITGAKMCTDLGLSRSFMTELRKGRIKNIGSERAARIAQYLGVSMEYLTGYGPRCRLDDPVERELEGYLEDLRRHPEKRMLFSVTKNATKEQIEAIVHMIEELRSTK